jgi:methionyl aminopeptidase
MIYLKSENEVERLRKSAQLVGRTLAEVARHLQPGVSTGELDEVAETFIRDHGGEPAFKGYQVGNKVYPASLCVSVDDEVVHGIPGDRVLDDGALVSIDCGILLDGYYGDSAYTFAVGEVSEEKQALLQVTIEALYRGIQAAVAGNRIGDISCAVQQYCESRGFGVVRELVGHGIGRQMHEDPQIPNFGECGQGRRLKDGLTACIEPMIDLGDGSVSTDDDGWTVRTAGGQPSAHYEHMIVVRPEGAELLSTFEYIEEVVEAPYNEVVL